MDCSYRCLQVLTQSGFVMGHRLPLEAFEAVQIAKIALQGQADAAELEKAQLACRRFLAEADPGGNSVAPESFATKAAMRLLWRDLDDSDTIDVIGYFLKMTDGFEDHSAEATAILKRYFLG